MKLIVVLLAVLGGKKIDLPFEKTTLPNGLEVIYHLDRRLPLVAVNVWYHVGAANEVAGRSGFAHLFEHMMFQGSAHVPPDQHFAILEAIGASEINGSTSFDRTNYYQTAPANHLETLLWLESDRMGFLLDTLTDGMLRNQKDVVRNERRQTFENRPYGKAEERLYQLLFPAPHPYHGVVIGSHQDLEDATLDEVRGFFRAYYAPSNATLVIAGDFDRQAAQKLVETYFGGLPTVGAPPPPSARVQAPPSRIVRETVEDTVQLPMVSMAWIAPTPLEPGSHDVFLLARVLAGSRSSRAHRRLVLERKLAQSVTCGYEAFTLGGVFSCQILGKPGTDPVALEKAFDAELVALRARGPSAAELGRARAGHASSILHLLEGVGQRADLLNHYEHYHGDPGHLARDLAAIEAVTPKSALAAAGKWLDPARRVIVVTVPKAAPMKEGAK